MLDEGSGLDGARFGFMAQEWTVRDATRGLIRGTLFAFGNARYYTIAAH